MTRVCPKCRLEKPLSEFALYRIKSTQRYRECRACNREYQRERWRKQVDRNREKRRAYHQRPDRKAAKRTRDLRVIYGVTPKDYEMLFAHQGGRCGVCRTNDPGNHRGAEHFHIDHNHETGEIRGLLCSNCNAGIGRFHDSADLLMAASLYLRQTRSFNLFAKVNRSWGGRGKPVKIPA